MSKDMPTSDWPDHADELSRKTLETFNRYVRGNTQGKVSDRELYIVVGALYDTTSGLVRQDVMRLLEAAHKELRTALQQRKAA